MELLIHAGLNKAGSSYLQAILHANEAALREQGISYTGGTSRNGNATPIVLDLRRGRLRSVRDRFDALVERARADGAQRLLLSSESLFHDFVVPEHRQRLISLIKACGLLRPRVLLIFREPVSHAISAYSHRAGRRHSDEFLPWLHNSYEVPREWPRFLDMYARETELELTLKPYSHNGLNDVLHSWLGPIRLPEPAPRAVNVSPTLTEAQILVRVRRVDAAMAERLRLAFKRIDKAHKAPDDALRQHYEHIARSELVKLNPYLERLSTLVGSDLTVPPPDPASEYDGVTILSPVQVEAIIAAASQRENVLARRLKALLRRLELRR